MAGGWGPVGYNGIVAWVEKNPDRMPKTLAELSTFPVAFRRVIVNMVPAEVRTAMWREHLQSFVDADSALDDRQQQFVREAMDELSVIFGSDRPIAEQRMKALEQKMMSVLTREQAYYMFAMLGPPEPPEGLPLPPGAEPRMK